MSHNLDLGDARKKRRARLAFRIVAGVVAALAVAYTMMLRGGRADPAIVAAAESPAPLVTTGECAGLSLTATVDAQSFAIHPRAENNTLAMSRHAKLTFAAGGPCRDIVILGMRGKAFESTLDGYVGTFASGPIVLDPVASGTETIYVQYQCDGCVYIDDPYLATITMHVHG